MTEKMLYMAIETLSKTETENFSRKMAIFNQTEPKNNATQKKNKEKMKLNI